MRRELAPLLRCPVCAAVALRLEVKVESAGEVREGSLRCSACGSLRGVRAGIPDLMPPSTPSFVAAEAAGLERFAATMRADGWTRESVLELPFRADGYWYAQTAAIRQALADPRLAPGKSILDVGANTCWASAMLADHGLEVTALDISTAEMQGLATADWWFEATGVYFERVLGVMFDLPFADGVFDLVWCCEVLHHNDRRNLARTLRELARVLKPQGTVIVANEPCRSLRRPRLRPGTDVAAYDGYEHVYQPGAYARAARRAGLEVCVLAPWTIRAFAPPQFHPSRRRSLRTRLAARFERLVRRSPSLARALLAFEHYVSGAASFYMLASKPAEAA